MTHRARAALGLLLAACHGHGGDGDEVYLDDASDEVLLTLKDAVERGEVTADDERCAHLVAPAQGEPLTTDDPPRFAWEQAELVLLHGRTTGDFVWLHLDCAGADPIDVLALETMEWTPEPEQWQDVAAAGGPCTVQLVSAYLDRGIIMEGGPFRPTVNPSFQLAAAR
jgi:hypothetical protein